MNDYVNLSPKKKKSHFSTVLEQRPNGRRANNTGTTKKIIRVHTATDITK